MVLKGLGEEKHGITYYWKIKPFSLCLMSDDLVIESSVFRIEELDNTEWRVLLVPNDDSGDIYLNIERDDENENSSVISVDIKLFLLKTNGDKIIKESENASFKFRDVLPNPLTLKRSAILKDKQLFLSRDTLTVGCFMKKHSGNMSASAVCTAYTEIFMEAFSFAFHFNISQQQIKTLSKPSVSKKYPNFKIILEPIHPITNSEFMTAKIVIDNSDTNILCTCKLSVQDTKKRSVFSFEGCHKYEVSTHERSWNLTNSVTSTEKIKSADSNYLMRGVLNVSDGIYSSYIKDFIYPLSAFQIKQQKFPNLTTELSLKEKLKSLHTDSRLCDFTLRVGGEEFRIHKAVLGAVSPYFCAMFELKMKENETSSSTIKDVDAPTMQRLVHFAYTEKVEELDWEDAIKLYKAADEFQFLEVKQYCAIYLIANLSIENVTELLVLSDMHQDQDLEEEIDNFMFAHAEQVFKSEEWSRFIESKMPVANKILQEMFVRLTSTRMF